MIYVKAFEIISINSSRSEIIQLAPKNQFQYVDVFLPLLNLYNRIEKQASFLKLLQILNRI